MTGIFAPAFWRSARQSQRVFGRLLGLTLALLPATFGCASKNVSSLGPELVPGVPDPRVAAELAAQRLDFTDESREADAVAENEDNDADADVPASKPESEFVDHTVEATDFLTDPPQVGDEITNIMSGQIPLEMNADVGRWIEYFTVRDPERFRRFMERGEKYRRIVTAVLKEQNVPTEMYYLAMIESGFATHATSHAKAVGIWQFMPATARRYGLRVDAYVDERRDPMRSTVAAALYLKDLHNVFQSWYLAMAAYNAGEGRIMGAIMRSKTRDFWAMVKQRSLPAETMNYIPKFLAATTIGHTPRKYGLDDLHPEMMPLLASVRIPSPIKLQDVATHSLVPLATLKELNPHLLHGVTPPGVESYRIWVPRDQVVAVTAKLDTLAQLRVPKRSVPVAYAQEGGSQHRVRRGDTLAKIARQYGVSTASLKSANNLKSTRLAVGKRLLIPGSKAKPASAPAMVAGSKSRGASVAAMATADAAAQSTLQELARYRVQRGDSLEKLSKRFNMSIDKLKKINHLKRNKIYAGQMLSVVSGERS